MTAPNKSDDREQSRQPPFQPTSEPVARAGRETAAQVRAHITRSFYSDPPILVVSMCDPWHDVDIGGDKDGYIERVKAIDCILSRRRRFYVVFDGNFGRTASITIRTEDLWVLNAQDGDPMAEAVVEALFDLGASVYVHSVYAMKPCSVQKLSSERTGRLLLDLHDCGHQEVDFMSGAEVQTRNGEYDAAAFDQLICATEQTAESFVAKHGQLKNDALIYPVFLETDPSDVANRDYNERPRILWIEGRRGNGEMPQMIDAMRRYVPIGRLSDPDANRPTDSDGIYRQRAQNGSFAPNF